MEKGVSGDPGLIIACRRGKKYKFGDIREVAPEKSIGMYVRLCF